MGGLRLFHWLKFKGLDLVADKVGIYARYLVKCTLGLLCPYFLLLVEMHVDLILHEDQGLILVSLLFRVHRGKCFGHDVDKEIVHNIRLVSPQRGSVGPNFILINPRATFVLRLVLLVVVVSEFLALKNF